MPRSVLCAVVVAVSLFLLPSSSPGAANAGAASWQIPVDVRAEGMGRAVGLLDPGPFAARVNPGAMGLVRGFEAGTMRSQLVPGLAPDVMFEYQGVAVGVPLPVESAGLNLAVHLNRTWLDYGESVATDAGSPEPIGTFESWEESYGGGLSVGVGDWLGLGVAVKEIEVSLGPAEYGGARDTQTAWSYGLLLKSPPLVLHGSREAGLRLSPSLGVASTNHGDAITLTRESRGDPLPKTLQVSAGALVEVGSAADFVNSRGAIDRVFRDVPLWAVTFAAGFEDDRAVETPEDRSAWWSRYERTSYGGFEVAWLGIVSARLGFIRDHMGGINNRTWGFGIEVPGLFGLDFANIPQYWELNRVHKTSVWMRVAW